jgi:hypothetical protein
MTRLRIIVHSAANHEKFPIPTNRPALADAQASVSDIDKYRQCALLPSRPESNELLRGKGPERSLAHENGQGVQCQSDGGRRPFSRFIL